MQNYLQLLSNIIQHGNIRTDRTNTGTKSLFGYQMRFNLNEGFPLLTTKKIHWKSIVYELLWFLSGNTNVAYLQNNKVRIWDEWADENGDLGPIYGKQWRSWETINNTSIDQISNLISEIKTNPSSRRLIVSAWNVADIDKMKLPPCHCLFQFYVHNNALSCQLYQRSADVFLGVPFNIASYALLTHLIAHVCGLNVGEFIHTFGDVHLYLNHTNQAMLQLQRPPFELPNIALNPAVTNIFDFTFNDIQLQNYTAHANIKASVAV